MLPVVTIQHMAAVHVTMHGMIFFFFQAEDGIRDIGVTGVQTCALPISGRDGINTGWFKQGAWHVLVANNTIDKVGDDGIALLGAVNTSTSDPFTREVAAEIGRASCRERV